MTLSQEIPWKRLTVEATAIVVSILLAFGIDAWWDERGERKAEVVLLERLLADFIDIQSGLKLVEDEHRDTSNACIAVLKIPTGEQLPNYPEMDQKLGLIFLTSRTFNPGSGAVASFLSGEGARLIQNQPLADHLLAWPGLVEELQEEEANLQKGVAERWTPYLASKVSLGPYITAIGGGLMLGLPRHVAIPEPRSIITVDQELANHVLDRFKWQQIALRDIEPVRTALEEILVLLEDDLNK